jgi:hypothetical protein
VKDAAKNTVENMSDMSRNLDNHLHTLGSLLFHLLCDGRKLVLYILP